MLKCPIPTPILIILREITLSKIGGHMAIFGGHAISSSHLTTRALDYNTPSQLAPPCQTNKGQLNSPTSNISTQIRHPRIHVTSMSFIVLIT